MIDFKRNWIFEDDFIMVLFLLNFFNVRTNIKREDDSPDIDWTETENNWKWIDKRQKEKTIFGWQFDRMKQKTRAILYLVRRKLHFKSISIVDRWDRGGYRIDP